MGGVVQGSAKTHRANEGFGSSKLFARVFTRDAKMAEIKGELSAIAAANEAELRLLLQRGP